VYLDVLRVYPPSNNLRTMVEHIKTFLSIMIAIDLLPCATMPQLESITDAIGSL